MKRIASFIALSSILSVVLFSFVRITHSEKAFKVLGLSDIAVITVAVNLCFLASLAIGLLVPLATRIRRQGRVIKQGDHEDWLLSAADDLATKFEVPVPKIVIYNCTSVSAYASGLLSQRATISLSETLLRKLSKAQVIAILAHEFYHVREADIFYYSIFRASFNSLSLVLGRLVGFAYLSKALGLSTFCASLISVAAMLFISQMAICWLSREKELCADSGGAQRIGAPNMISAISALSSTTMTGKASSLFSLSAGASGSMNLASLSPLATHPSPRARVASLRKTFGLK
jgi:heat shock protein HtpX